MKGGINMKRYVWEWTWGGYRSGQARVCHREVLKLSDKRVERYKNLFAVQFGDGTTMTAELRQAKPREKITEINSYYSLVRDALYSGKGYYKI